MRASNFLCVVAAIALASSMAMAIDMGPGGRIYSTEMNWGAQSIGVASVKINPDWTVEPVIHQADIGEVAYYRNLVGSTTTNQQTRWQVYGGLEPQIKVSNPGGYAKLTFGAYGTGAPASYLIGQTKASTTQVLQIFDVQTGATGGTVSIVGQGRATEATNVTQYNTDTAIAAWYDKTGSITGKPDSYLLTHWAGYEGGADVCWDNDGNGDYTDNAAGYLGNVWPGNKLGGYVMDAHQYGNRLYVSCQQMTASDCYGATGIGYWTNNPNPTAEDWFAHQNRFYADKAVASDNPTGGIVSTGGPALLWGKFVPATINGKDTIFAISCPTGDWAHFNICKYQDLDGDFTKLAAGEVETVFSNDMTTVAGATIGYPEPIEAWGGNTFDIDMMTNADGVPFLVISKIDQLLIVQLGADGKFAGLGQANPNDYVKVIDAPGIGHNISIDAVPEPATMVLLALGGVAAMLKRRNS